MLSGRKSALSLFGATVCVAVSGRSLTGLEILPDWIIISTRNSLEVVQMNPHAL